MKMNSPGFFSEWLHKGSLPARRLWRSAKVKCVTAPLVGFVGIWSWTRRGEVDLDEHLEERRWVEYTQWDVGQMLVNDYNETQQEMYRWNPEVYEEFNGFPDYINPYVENKKITNAKRNIEKRLEFFNPFEQSYQLERWDPNLYETLLAPQGRMDLPDYSPYLEYFENTETTAAANMGDYRKEGTGRDWQTFMQCFTIWIISSSLIGVIHGMSKGMAAAKLIETRHRKEVPMPRKMSMIYGGGYEGFMQNWWIIWKLWWRGLIIMWFSRQFLWPKNWEWAPIGTAAAYFTWSRMGQSAHRTPVQKFLVFGGSLFAMYLFDKNLRIHPYSPREVRDILGIPYPTEFKIKQVE